MNGCRFIYPYYEASRMLQLQVENWNSYGRALRKAVKIIVVDDGSPTQPALPVMRQCKVPCAVYRIQEDYPWNMHGARNLGAQVAGPGDPWLFLSDVDIVLPAEMAERMLKARLDERRHYTFERTMVINPRLSKVHCNTFLVKRSVYWSTGGYDEDYRGTYSGDGPFLDALKKAAPNVHRTDIMLVGYGRMEREGKPAFEGADCALDRKSAAKAYQVLRKKKLLEGNVRPCNPLRFTWARVR
jgi:hypothetical protein